MSALRGYLADKREAVLSRRAKAAAGSAEKIAELHKAVERVCPILNLLQNPQAISGRVVQNGGTELAAAD